MHNCAENSGGENSKSIFIGGFSHSGKTLLRNLLNKHHEIAAFGETKLTNHKIFFIFPKEIVKYPPHQRTPLLNIFKQLCTTYFYCYLMGSKGSQKDKAWLYYEGLWKSRLQFPQSFFWNNPIIWPILEILWIPKLLEKFVSPSYHKKGFWPVGWRGLYPFLTKRDIKQCFTHLTPLIDATNVNEAYRIYGTFWSHVFKGYAKKQQRKYWAEESPGNCFATFFLKQCFNGLKFINLIRDGRDAACSINEHWGSGIKSLLNEWATNLRLTLKYQTMLTSQDYINIRYEDLVANTRCTLKKITDFLGVDFDENMLSFPIDPTWVGRYKSEFSAELKEHAKEHYGSLLNQLGYPT